MSKIVAAAAIRGANKIAKMSEDLLNKAIKEKGKEQKIEFPETAFYLPMAYALLGVEVKTLGDMVPILEHIKSLLHQEPSEKLWLPYLGDALDSGVATLLAEEIIVALRYLYGQEPQPDCEGFFTDTVLRTLGIQLVDGRMPGFAAIIGAAPDNKTAVEIVRQLQKRNILSFVGSSVKGRSIIDQLKEEKVEMGWETYIVPYGRDTITGIYPLHWAIRGALTFGGHKKGEALKCLKYCKDRVFAFGLALGEVDDLKYATGAGAINMGFPVIADTNIPEIRPTGICTYEHLVKQLDHKKIVPTCIEVRGVKVKVSKIPIPVSYSAAFEGERVRREQMYVQFGGKYSTAFEYVRSRGLDEVEDGKIELIGPDVDSVKEGEAMPLGILVEVAGRKMQKDFEPILERQVHSFLNEAMGIFHMGQRNMCWMRISKDAYKKGFRLKHFGVILHARLHDTFAAIVDKAQITIYTKQEDVEKIMAEAMKAYDARDERLAGMIDESVDTFYSCTLCQSFAPNHVCMVKPERLGLCGAYSYLDAKASYELNPVGPNQPVKKREVLDATRGEWKGINNFIYQKSNKTLERFHGYSIMTFPETSCCVGETGVIIENKFIKIGDFIEKYRGTSEFSNFYCSTLGTTKAINDKIIAMQKFAAPLTLVKIITKSGRSLIVTPDHKIAVDRANGLTWMPVEKIKKGERIYALKNLEMSEKIPRAIDTLSEDFRIDDQQMIRNLKHGLKKKYGSLSNAFEKLKIKFNPWKESFNIRELKAIFREVGEDWEELKGQIGKTKLGKSNFHLNGHFTNELFYILGLLSSDGSIYRAGRQQYKVTFVNTCKVLCNIFKKLYKEIFPDKKILIHIKSKSEGQIRGRKIISQKKCFVIQVNNPLLGNISSYFGLRVGSEGRWNLGQMLSLPKEYIASFLAGNFDGDGSIRIRSYKNKWEIGEAYFCIEDYQAAIQLQLLLNRLGIVGNIRKSGSVYKIVLHGDNLQGFCHYVPIKHPKKVLIAKKIKKRSNRFKMDKTQREVLPYFVGKLLAKIPKAKEVLSPSTLFYYKTARSRPVASNVLRVATALPEEERKVLSGLLENDYFLDTVTSVEKIRSRGNKHPFVYNLTLAEKHHYFANGLLIKNCGCFECIIAILPEANGFMIVNREYGGMTPCGMTFSTLAGSVGGGAQTPGFMGIGRLYIVSKKFISADGGLKRIVWMAKELKEHLGDKLKKRCEEEGDPDLINKIADETVATTSEELLAHLQKVKHPVLEMPPLM